MKKCQNCNTYLEDGVHFCTNCGSSSLETVNGVLKEGVVDVQASQEKGVVVQYVVKERSLKESIENFRQKILDLLRSYRVTEVLLEWAGFLMCLGPTYAIVANFPELGLYSASVTEWMGILSSIGILLSLVDLKHGAFAFLFAVRGIDVLVAEIVRFSSLLKYSENYNIELSSIYSLPGKTVGTLIFLVILFAIAFSNYKKAKGGY